MKVKVKVKVQNENRKSKGKRGKNGEKWNKEESRNLFAENEDKRKKDEGKIMKKLVEIKTSRKNACKRGLL